MTSRLPIDAFILAGGVSSRMGSDKGLLEFGGMPLIVSTYQLVASFAHRATIVGPVERYAAFGLRVIPDQHFSMQIGTTKSKGPLYGIAAALSDSQTSWSLILACDLPYLNAQWLRSLAQRAMESSAQVVIPQTARGLEPLAAAYKGECAGAIAKSLVSGVDKLTEAIRALSLEIVPEDDAVVLKNMNTMADYDEALSWWAQKRGTRTRRTGSN